MTNACSDLTAKLTDAALHPIYLSDGSCIAFMTSSGNSWGMNADGTGKDAVWAGEGAEWRRRSPNAMKLLFNGMREGGIDLCGVDAAGGDVTNVTDLRARCTGRAAWY